MLMLPTTANHNTVLQQSHLHKILILNPPPTSPKPPPPSLRCVILPLNPQIDEIACSKEASNNVTEQVELVFWTRKKG